MPSAAMYVGLDVGGTTMKAAVVDDGGRAFKAVSNDTNSDRGQTAGLHTMTATIEAAVEAAGLTMADIAAVGVATPGLMDIRAGLILDPPNFPGWKNVPVREHVQKAFGKPTAYQNDANAAAFAEKWVGAAKGTRSMVMFTLGTGVGGAVVVGDTVIEGEHSHGGELGHLRIDLPDRGRRCGCGARGCLEAYASASAVVDRARDELASWRGPTELKKYQTVFDQKAFNAEVIFNLADAGDECAHKVVDDTAYYLALGACAAIAAVDPEVIVIGGGMAKSKAFLAKVDEYVRRYGLPYPTHTARYAKELGRTDLPAAVKVVFAELGETAGYIGAAGCARALASRAT